MGVRIFGDMKVFSFGQSAQANRPMAPQPGSFRMTRRLNGARSLEIIYDGTAGKEGLPAQLNANEIWIDPSTVWNEGLNLGLTFGYNSGTTNAVVSGCSLPRDYAYKVGDVNYAANIYAQASTLWTAIGTVSPGVVATTGLTVYSLLRIVFGAGAGSVVINSR